MCPRNQIAYLEVSDHPKRRFKLLSLRFDLPNRVCSAAQQGPSSAWLNLGPLTTKAARQRPTSSIRLEPAFLALRNRDPSGQELGMAAHARRPNCTRKGWFGLHGDQPAPKPGSNMNRDSGKPLSELCIVLQEWAITASCPFETDLLNRMIVFDAGPVSKLPPDLVASLEKALERQGITPIHATPKEVGGFDFANLKTHLKPVDVKPLRPAVHPLR